MESSGRTPLEIGFSCLSIGGHSVGLPPTRSGDQLVEAYLDLISRVRKTRPEYFREEDIDLLAVETRLEDSYIRNRVVSHLAGSSIPA